MIDRISVEFLNHLHENHGWPAPSPDQPYSMSTDWRPCQQCEDLSHRLAIFKTQSFIIRVIDGLLFLTTLGQLVEDIISKGLLWGFLSTINTALSLAFVMLLAANIMLFSNGVLRQSLKICCVHLRDIDDPIDGNTGTLWVIVATRFAYAGATDTRENLFGLNIERAVISAVKHAFFLSCFLQLAVFPLSPSDKASARFGGATTDRTTRLRSSRTANVLARLGLLLLVTTQCTVSLVMLAVFSLKLRESATVVGFLAGVFGYLGLMTLLVNQWVGHRESLIDCDEVVRRVVEMA